MDIFAIFLVAVVSLMFGIILTISVQYYIFYIYLKKSPVATIVSQKKTFDYFLPEVSVLVVNNAYLHCFPLILS